MATDFEVLDLPEPLGPSIATTMPIMTHILRCLASKALPKSHLRKNN